MDTVSIIVLILLSIIFGLIFTTSTKKYQLIMPDTKIGYFVFSLITSVVALIIFFIKSNFVVYFNKTIFIYSLILASMCFISYVIAILSLKYSTIFLNNIVSKAGGIIIPYIFGVTLFKEALNIRSITSCVLILISAFIFINKPNGKGNINFKIIIINILLFSISPLSIVLNKGFGIYVGEKYIYSYYFYTNVIIFIVSVIVIMSDIIINKSENSIKEFKLKHYLLIMLKAAGENCGTVVTTILLVNLTTINYLSVTSVGGVLVVVGASLIYKEKLGIKHLISIILSLGASFIN